MTLYNHFHAHNFLKNKEMNEIYISTGFTSFALGLISIFEPIFLYKSGLSMTSILIFFLSVSIFFVLFSFLGAKITSRLGVKHTLLISLVFMIVYYSGLRFVPTYWPLLYILPLVKAFKLMLYNYSFHLNFIEHSDCQNRGKEISTIQAVSLIASIASPFVGSIILKYSNFATLMGVGSLFLLTAIIPLLLTKDIHEEITFNNKNIFKDIFKKENLPIIFSFSGYAVESWIGFAIWPIFLFVILKNVESIGAIASTASFLTFIVFYFIGKKTDSGDKTKLLKIGSILYFFSWAGRVFASNVSSAVFIDTYKNITQQILQIPWSAYSYDIASKRDKFKFIVQREIIFNISRIIVIPILILVFIVDYHPFIISFAIAAIASLLYSKINGKIV